MAVLHDNEIHLWSMPLNRTTPGSAAVLSADERERADRFHFQRDRDSFVTCRSALRMKLGEYLDQPPESIEFHYGPFGKPGLQSGSGLHFNVSHSAHTALIAFTRIAPIGVDVVRSLPDFESLVSQVFSPAERSQLEEFDPNRRLASFFAGWTRKEALIKATGQGLQIPLPSIHVCMNPTLPPRIISSQCPQIDTAHCQLLTVAAPTGYSACAAIMSNRPDLKLSQMEFV